MEVLYFTLRMIAVIAVFLLAIILFRTLVFRPKKATPTIGGQETFDRDRAVETLSELIKCKTVSNRNPELEDNAEFEKLVARLPKLYPQVGRHCRMTRMDDRALLFHWVGERHDEPVVLMSHYDVVPADADKWEKPPFEGIVEDGVLWGRGSLDTKVTVNAILSAANHLIGTGFVPTQDIYFAFSGGEEINGRGALNIVEFFERRGITPAFVLDEGGAVVEGAFPGVKKPCAMIGIAEKGMMDVEYRVSTDGGHASAPKPRTPVGMLADACRKIEKTPFPTHLTKPVAAMFDTLGRHSSFLYRMLFANLWAFGDVLDIICKKRGGELNALMRTTVAFTQMQGSEASNVLPTEARMVSNIRLNPDDTVNGVFEQLNRMVKEDGVKLHLLHGTNPSEISDVDCPSYDKIAMAIASTWRGCVVSPYLMVQCSDSRHYGRLSHHVYRFSAMDLTAEERASIHGNNERIRLETVYRSVEFYIRLMKLC